MGGGDDVEQDRFGDGLVHSDRLILQWRYPAAIPDAIATAALIAANERFLRALTAIGERNPEHRDEHPELTPDLQRLEFKLDLLLDMVGETLHRQMDLPAAVAVRLSAGGVEWFTTPLPDTGRLIALDLYLRADMPRPLSFFGVVEPSRPAGGVRVPFAVGCSREIADGLEKFIFRQHRRSIASRRQGDS